jgi:hypothetical protein
MDEYTMDPVYADGGDGTVNSADANLNPTSSGLSTFFGGFLSKAAEVGLDIVKAKNSPVSVYPTGQTNPAQLTAAAQASQAAQSAATKNILLIGGAVALGAILLLVAIRKTS